MLMPVFLVLIQPDLGTAVLLLMGGFTVMLLSGVRWWVFGTLGAAALAAMPVFWANMRDYQKDRVFTFLNPERDPLGTGYHILQSKIALGSGGVWGKGFMQGTQSHLNFLPEKQTDFIFTTLAEEMGMVGGLLLLAGAFAMGRSQSANVHAVIQDILGHGNEKCLLPGQPEAEAARLSAHAGGLLFTASEIAELAAVAQSTHQPAWNLEDFPVFNPAV